MGGELRPERLRHRSGAGRAGNAETEGRCRAVEGQRRPAEPRDHRGKEHRCSGLDGAVRPAARELGRER